MSHSLETGLTGRMRRFVEKPLHEKSRSVYARWRKAFPKIPFPVRLPFGVWFIARDDYLGSTLTFDGFEPAERAFVQRFLTPGMTVLDIGAHHGLYTLLAAKLVGPTGKVFAFEPSPRERKALALNVTLNRCKNVSLQPLALGGQEGLFDLHIAGDGMTGFNSFRPSVDAGKTLKVSVRVTTLDNWITATGIHRVDFIKLDVEGGELSVLSGARELLTRQPRPIILAEVEDRRTAPWGYAANEIVRNLAEAEFDWYELREDGSLTLLRAGAKELQANLVAVPRERKEEVLSGGTGVGRGVRDSDE
jgi:FkbM family methyltransferase